MGDTITQAEWNEFLATLGIASAVQRDNHGNIRYGQKIACANGKSIDYPKFLSRTDEAAIVAARVDNGDYGFTDVHPLGQLESPLKQRCREAEEKQR